MKTSKTLAAKVLTVVTHELNSDSTSEFEALEFSNGLILVAGSTTNDWFFEDRDSIEACGNDVVNQVKESGSVVEWTSQELLKSIQGSLKEFGVDSVPPKHFELWK